MSKPMSIPDTKTVLDASFLIRCPASCERAVGYEAIPYRRRADCRRTQSGEAGYADGEDDALNGDLKADVYRWKQQYAGMHSNGSG
jgi:hypothetical protein